MGTTYHISWVQGAHSPSTESVLKRDVDALLARVNQSMSTYIPDSELSRLNSAPAGTRIKVSKDLFMLLQHALNIAQITNGSFDPTIGPLVNLWGFGPKKGPRLMPTEAQIQKAKKSVGYQNIKLWPQSLEVLKERQNMYVDLSASAKGYGVDQVAELLEEKGISNFLVEIGGEMRVKGRKPDGAWLVAIESPVAGERSIQKVLKLSDSAIATSGDYRNFFEDQGKRYSHTIDVATGHPIQNLMASVTVIDSKSCMNADAWATAITALGPEQGLAMAKKQGIMAYIIFYRPQADYSRFDVQWTEGFERLFEAL